MVQGTTLDRFSFSRGPRECSGNEGAIQHRYSIPLRPRKGRSLPTRPSQFHPFGVGTLVAVERLTGGGLLKTAPGVCGVLHNLRWGKL